MNLFKWTLIGGAALVATASVAQADDIADLKAQVESLNARVAQMQAAPAVPAGYSLMTMHDGAATEVMGAPVRDKNYSKNASYISIMPTADAPVASLEWSGYVRAMVGYVDKYKYVTKTRTYSDPKSGIKRVDTDGNHKSVAGIDVRGQLKVIGKTETSVGEVGGRIQLRGDAFSKSKDYDDIENNQDASSIGHNNSVVVMNEAWGWWQMEDDLNFGGGWTGTLGNIGYGVDAACTCNFTDNSDAFDYNPGDNEQIRLTWGNGPVVISGALEDGNNMHPDMKFNDSYHEFGAAGKIAYAGDSFSGAISGWLGENDRGKHAWQVGVGGSFGLGDDVNLSAGGAYGKYGNGKQDEYWGFSVLASMNLAEAFRAELGFGYKDYKKLKFADKYAVLAGFYYEPVAELQLGIEGEYDMRVHHDSSHKDPLYLGFTTVWRFHE